MQCRTCVVETPRQRKVRRRSIHVRHYIIRIKCTTLKRTRYAIDKNNAPYVRNDNASYLRNRSALAVNCCVIIHCLEVSCKECQITSAQRE